LLGEIRDLRRMQAEILQLQAQVLSALRSWPARQPAAPAPDADSMEPPEDDVPALAPPPLPRVRQRCKTVLVIDDDAHTLRAAVAALETAQVPVRSASSGHAGVAAIAASKPDVIVLELDLGEPMPGRDFVNTLKATMEWVDVRLVLHTRLPIASAQEARVQHGADDFVLKGPGSAEALVNRVIALFQRA
jgi:CheY-like chemotaxis protein